MIIAQSKWGRIRHAFSRAAIACGGIALGSTISAMQRGDAVRLLAVEHLCVLSASLLVTSALVWIFSDHIEVALDAEELRISRNGSKTALVWSEIERITPPTLLESRWTFQLPGQKKARLSVAAFQNQDRKRLASAIHKYDRLNRNRVTS